MALHQLPDGHALGGVGISEAQVARDPGAQAQLLNAQLRIALLAVADDKKPVLSGQRFHGLCHPGIAHLTAVFLQVPVFPVHAPLHQRQRLLPGKGGKELPGDFRHHLAEQGLQGFRVHCVSRSSCSCRL